MIDMGRELALLKNMSDSFFEDVPLQFRKPLSDVTENKREYLITADLPGVEKKDIHIRPRNGGLEIQARKKSEAYEEDENFYHHERSFAGFYRYYSFGDDAQTQKAQATLKDGVLRVKIPKKTGMKEKEIEVK